jgi:hypothetical protein
MKVCHLKVKWGLSAAAIGAKGDWLVTIPCRNAGGQIFSSTLYEFCCRPGGDGTEHRFFLALGTRFSSKSPEMRLDRPAAPTSLWARPFKIF